MNFFYRALALFTALFFCVAAYAQQSLDNPHGLSLAAVRSGNLVRLKELIEQHGANIETPNTSKVTPLMTAAYLGNLAMVNRLLEKNANIHAVDQLKKTAIVYAAGSGHTEVVARLLEAGIDINARYPNELTALMWAAGAGHDKTVALLLERGADPALQDNRGKTALQMADDAGHLAVKRVLNGAGGGK